jgi:hypothetical protein
MSTIIESQPTIPLDANSESISTPVAEPQETSTLHTRTMSMSEADANIVHQALVNSGDAAHHDEPSQSLDELDSTLTSLSSTVLPASPTMNDQASVQATSGTITEHDSVIQAIVKLNDTLVTMITEPTIVESTPTSIIETPLASAEEPTTPVAETRSLNLREWLKTTVRQLRSDILPEITTRIMNDTTITTLRERASSWYSGLDDAAHRSINIFGGGMVAYVGALTLFGSGYMSGTLGVGGAATTAYYHLSHPHQA